MIKISYLDSNSDNTTSNVFKRIVSEHNTCEYLLNTGDFILKFTKDSISIVEESNNNVTSNSTPKKSNSLKDFFTMLFNTTATNTPVKPKSTSILFDNLSNGSIELISPKLLSINVSNDIKLNISLESNKPVGYFEFINNSNLENLNLKLSDASNFSIDGEGNLTFSLKDFLFVIKAPVVSNVSYKFVLENSSITLDMPVGNINDDTNPALEYNTLNTEMENTTAEKETSISIKATPIQPVYDVGVRTLLVNVEKSKLNYLYSAADNVLCCPNLGMVNDLYITEEILYKEEPVQIPCPSGPSKVYNVKIPYKLINYKPYISYSLSLYNYNNTQLSSTPVTTCLDGLYIYAHENDVFVGEEAPICSSMNDTALQPVDFEVILNATYELLPDTTLKDYFVYLVTVKVSITKAPPINDDVSPQVLEDLNVALGRDPDSTAPITRGELETILRLDISNSGSPGLDVLSYTPHLIYLRSVPSTFNGLSIPTDDLFAIKETSTIITDITQLQVVQYLEELILNGNDISDISVFKYLPNLNTVEMADNNITDISPLKYSNKIVTLNLNENKINEIDVLSNLNELVTLNLSQNAISNIYALSNLDKLEEINVSDQDISLEIILLPEEDGTYELYTDFLVDLDGNIPCIEYASDGGYCLSPDSCLCTVIVWPSTAAGKEVYFTFNSDYDPTVLQFNGTVRVKLAPPSVS